MNIFVANFMIWGILELKKDHYFCFCWILARLVTRIIKHVYNIYINMGLRFELVWLDYFRFTSFYVLYPLENICSYILIYFVIDDLR